MKDDAREALCAWLLERERNARTIAASRRGDDCKGWIEDANYFRAAFEAARAPISPAAQEGERDTRRMDWLEEAFGNVLVNEEVDTLRAGIDIEIAVESAGPCVVGRDRVQLATNAVDNTAWVGSFRRNAGRMSRWTNGGDISRPGPLSADAGRASSVGEPSATKPVGKIVGVVPLGEKHEGAFLFQPTAQHGFKMGDAVYAAAAASPEVERDAERYRWLRAIDSYGKWTDLGVIADDALDRHIDAALAAVESLRAALASSVGEPSATARHPDVCLVINPTENTVEHGCSCGLSADWEQGVAFAWNMCQQHINDAIDRDVEGAARWYVVKAYVAAPPESPEVVRDAKAVEVCKLGDYGPVQQPMATVLLNDRKIAECYTNEDAQIVGAALAARKTP